MAYAYDAERPVGRLPALRAREMDEHGADPLQHTAGIAAGGCGDVDAAGGAPGEVDMVESDGRRGDEPHASLRAAWRRIASMRDDPGRRRRGRWPPYRLAEEGTLPA